MDIIEHFGSTGLLEAEFDAEFAALSQPCLAIIDDNRLRRDCVKQVLAQQQCRWRVTDAGSAAELVEGREQEFDTILLTAASSTQIDLGEVAALAAAGPVLVAADYDDPEQARLILRAGARGFVPASLGLAVLLAALERVRAGGTYMPAMMKAPASPRPLSPGSQGGVWSGLTRRQREVLALITQGKSNKLIADALMMSEDTVKAHVKQIIRRLNVANRTQAALLAARTAAPQSQPARR